MDFENFEKCIFENFEKNEILKIPKKNNIFFLATENPKKSLILLVLVRKGVCHSIPQVELCLYTIFDAYRTKSR